KLRFWRAAIYFLSTAFVDARCGSRKFFALGMDSCGICARRAKVCRYLCVCLDSPVCFKLCGFDSWRYGVRRESIRIACDLHTKRLRRTFGNFVLSVAVSGSLAIERLAGKRRSATKMPDAVRGFVRCRLAFECTGRGTGELQPRAAFLLGRPRTKENSACVLGDGRIGTRVGTGRGLSGSRGLRAALGEHQRSVGGRTHPCGQFLVRRDARC